MIRFVFIIIILFGVILAVLIPSRPDLFFAARTSALGLFESKEVSLVFVGDVMLSRKIGELIEENNTYFPFIHVKEYISSFDIAFANLENPVSSLGENVGSIYSFRAHPNTMVGLRDSGFDVISLANNHVFDYGPTAFLDSISQVSKVGIKVSGAGKTREEAHAPVLFTKNGVKIAYLSYSQFASPSQYSGENGFAVAGTKIEDMEDDIHLAKSSGADIVVASFHWGNEYQILHNEFQQKIAHTAVDAGADLVIGHHPHVIQDTEWYKDSFIVYSLGNFIFDQNFSKDTREGGVLEVLIKNRVISKVELKKVHFTKEYQPYFND